MLIMMAVVIVRIMLIMRSVRRSMDFTLAMLNLRAMMRTVSWRLSIIFVRPMKLFFLLIRYTMNSVWLISFCICFSNSLRLIRTLGKHLKQVHFDVFFFNVFLIIYIFRQCQRWNNIRRILHLAFLSFRQCITSFNFYCTLRQLFMFSATFSYPFGLFSYLKHWRSFNCSLGWLFILWYIF